MKPITRRILSGVVGCLLFGSLVMWAQAPSPLPMRKGVGPRTAPSTPPTLICHAQKTHVLPGEILQIAARAEGFDPDSLRYIWSAKAGVLKGIGPMVLYDTSGLHPGVYEIVVDATDCYDEKAECSTLVTVDSECPPDAVPSINLRPNKSSVLEGAGVDFECDGVSVLKDGIVQYRWATSAGSLTGVGNHMRLDTSALKAPAIVDVTCFVSDQCGTARLMAPVTLAALPQPKIQPINCVSGQFPYDSARINNVDKACLDDLALKLQNDSGATLLITGYAAPNEHGRERLALKRAESAKTFLLRTHHIEANRIEARAAAAGSTVAPVNNAEGRRKNRALQITFLPAGSNLKKGAE